MPLKDPLFLLLFEFRFFSLLGILKLIEFNRLMQAGRAVRVYARSRQGGLSSSTHQIDFTFDMLTSNFHLPMHKAAEKFGVGGTAFKNVCRKFGLLQWPYKRIKQSQEMLTPLTPIPDVSCAVDDYSLHDFCQPQCPPSTPIHHFARQDQDNSENSVDSDDMLDSAGASFQPEEWVQNRGEMDACDTSGDMDCTIDKEVLFLLNYPLRGDFWTAYGPQPAAQSDIPGSAAVNPFSDPFHHDWFLNQTA